MELTPSFVTLLQHFRPVFTDPTFVTFDGKEREQPQLAIDYIASFLGRLTRDEVQRYYERYISPYFSSDGRVELNVAEHAVDAELGVAAASVDQMYQPAL